MRLFDRLVPARLTAVLLLTPLAALATCGGGDGGVLPPAVVRPVVGTLRLQPDSLLLAPGASAGFSATVLSTTGSALGDRAVAWSIANAAVATVTQDGRVTAVAAGTTTVTATSEGVSASARVVVTAPTIPIGAIAIDITPTTTFQTISGWEATAQIGETECNKTAYPLYKQQLLDRAVDELGITRLRIPLRSSAESRTDWFGQLVAGAITGATWNANRYTAVNDNADPNVIDPAGFVWTELDSKIDEIANPLRQRLAARGEKLYVNLNFTDFSATRPAYAQLNTPAEFAELLLAAYQHLQTKYGWVPDAIEILLEPDNRAVWAGPDLGRAIAAANTRLRAAGFTPEFIGPSTMASEKAAPYWDQMIQANGGAGVIRELSYHRYGTVTTQHLRDIDARRVRDGVRTAMLEHIGSGIDDLLDDLTIANNAAWQQFTIGFCGPTDDGGTYYRIDQSTPTAPRVLLSGTSTLLRQVFAYVRPGAVRIDASSANSSAARPIAFRNANGRTVVVVRTFSAQQLAIRGLPAGTYAVNYGTATGSGATTVGTAANVNAADVVVDASGVAVVSIPAGGAITLRQR
ncbi:MAG: Ig-like domain-containing protein [Gemmatimonadetes bacterium]|nr:Ig-like domain-containing protein [Gemmatimonadota bacterium]